jgi:hypothetical protein
MAGNVRFDLRLDPPDNGGPAQGVGATAVPPLAGQPAQANVVGAPAPPRLPYAPDPGTYTQLWMSQSSTTTGAEMVADVDSYLSVFAVNAPAYSTIQMSVLASSEFMAFLTVVSGDMVTVVQSLGRFSGGLGRQLLSHNRVFGLIGEKVGGELPPKVMAPMAGITPWLQIMEVALPTDAELEALAGSDQKTIVQAVAMEDDEDGAEQPAADTASVQKLGYIPREWAAYFLEPISPWQALQRIRALIATLSPTHRPGFDYLLTWGKAACVRTADTAEGSVLRARWQNPHPERQVVAWMQRHTRMTNAIPLDPVQPGVSSAGLDPQQCFDKAMETVAALKASPENKKYSGSELQRLRAGCSLTVGEMRTSLPAIHSRLLTEGRTRRGTEAVLAQMLKPDDSDDPGLIYISPELIADIKDCKYGLGWDTSYRHCHRGLSPFSVPHMSLKHQQERQVVTDRLSKASSTTTEDVERAESSPSPAPRDYHGLLQLLSNYIRLLKAVVGARSKHTKEVVAIRSTLRRRMDLFMCIGPKEIVFLLWAIFLDSREFFAHQIEDTDDLPESSLRYTTSFLGVGRISTDLLGVPLNQFLVASNPPSSGRGGGGGSGTGENSRSDKMFREAPHVPQVNKDIPDEISTLTMPLLERFPKATMASLMAHSDLKYDDIRVGNKGACLNLNLLGICSDSGCQYRHSKSNPTAERVTAVSEKLAPAIAKYMTDGGPSGKRKRGPGS